MRRRGPLSRTLLTLIRGYQWVSAASRPSCRFSPSCSQYAGQAIEVHGPVRGAWLALRRLGRCHPWGGQGYDPVPGATARSPIAIYREQVSE